MCLLAEPFPLWHAAFERPELRGAPLVSVRRGRVIHVSSPAKKLGVVAGESVLSAQANVPELEVVEAHSPHLLAEWDALVEEVSGLTRTLEAPKQGKMFLALEEADATQLAQAYGMRAGGAASVEVAHLSAVVASPGTLRVTPPEREAEFLRQLPLYALRALGLRRDAVQRLGWLGVERVGQLQEWTSGQLEAYLGKEAKPLIPYLYGPHRTTLSRYTPPLRVAASHTFGEAVSEPHALYPILEKLSRQVTEALGRKSAHRLTLVAAAQGIDLKATRIVKTPLSDAATINRLAHLALHESNAQPLGVQSLKLELSALSRPSAQGTLWQQKENRERAIRAVSERFPDALLKLEEVDPCALAKEHRFRFISLNTGEEVTSETPDVAPTREPEPAEQPPNRPVSAA